MKIDQFLKFDPILKNKIWGGDKLSVLLGKKSDRNDIGESWEISDVENDTLTITKINDQDISNGEAVSIYDNNMLVGSAEVVDNKIVFTSSENLQSLSSDESKDIVFNYSVSDGEKTSVEELNIKVDGLNDVLAVVTYGLFISK